MSGRQLTPGQQGLWFLHLLAPRDPAYNSCTAIELTGPLRPAALRAAIRQFGLRHDTMRATLSEVEGEPRQSPASEPPAMRLVDLSGLPLDRRAAEVARQLRQLARIPFDLRGGVPVRWLLLRCEPRRHVLVFDAHHIVFDRDSLAVACRELAEYYAACDSGQPLPRRAEGASDAHLVGEAWAASDQELDQSLRFWRSWLQDMPTDNHVFSAALAEVRREPVRQTVPCAGAELQALSAICTTENATTFMGALALLACLIERHTGQRDVVVGAPISLRSDDRHEQVVGLLANLVPLRLRLDERSSFRSVLRQARDLVLDAIDHRRVPLHRILQQLESPRGGRDSPLQVMLTHQREAVAPRLRALASAVQPIPAAAAKYELTVTATESSAGLELDLEADQQGCGAAELADFAQRLRTLLPAIAREPDAPLAAIEPLDPAAKAEALRRAAGPRVPRPPTTSLHGLVATSVQRNPDAVAVAASDATGHPSQLSYAALSRSARHLAHALRLRGAGIDRPVGVLLERGTGLPVSYLAVLMAGGAVLPLEPDDPDGRLAVLLGESATRLVVTDARLRERAERLGVATIDIADFLRPATGVAGARLGAATAHPEQAAYVLFTSGSTGAPKGVVVPHRGIVNRVLWARETLGLQVGERVLLKTPVSFDVSVPELFWPLVTGARLVIAEPGAHRDPQYLAEVVTRERVTYIHFVPSMLGPFLDEVERGGLHLPSLRLLACSGEALPDELAERAGATLTAQLWNLYGPTEASVDVAAWPAVPSGRGPVALGRPIANTECRIVDERLRPVPPTVAGELYLAGDCLARGYLNQPGLTAARFLPAPSAASGTRLYRTGDFGRWGPAGVIQWVGRRDQQVKILGRRVELGEVRAVLRRLPGVSDAAVVVRGNRLVAFAVPDRSAGPEPPAPEVVLDQVRSLLPAYLVPAMVAYLPRLPTTRNGKVDEPALQRRAADLAPTAIAIGPRNELERVLVAAWCAVLDRSAVGVHDGFFEAGGDSLALLRLHRRVASEVAPDLTVAELFRFPTVAALAAYLADRDLVVATAAHSAATAAARASRRRAAVVAQPARPPQRAWQRVRPGGEADG